MYEPALPLATGESVEKRDIHEASYDLFLRHQQIIKKKDAVVSNISGLIAANPLTKDRPAGPVEPVTPPLRERKFLVLFSGTDSVGETLRKMYPKCTIVNMDIDEAAPNLTHCVDVLEWKYKLQYKPGDFDYIFASPPCTGFSNAQAMNPDSIEKQIKFQLGCKMAQKAIEIIEYLQPDEFFLENPKGQLRHQDFMKKWKVSRTTTSYCMFGAPYRKDTDVWSKWPVLLPRCAGDTLCDNKRKTGTHPQSALLGKMKDQPGTPRMELYRLPEGLVQSLMKQTEKRAKASYLDSSQSSTRQRC